MDPQSRLRIADARMTDLLAGAVTVTDAAARLAADRDRLAWLPIDLRTGDLQHVLERVTSLPAHEIIAAMYKARRAASHAATTQHYRDLAAHDQRASLDRAAPRTRTDDREDG